MNQYIFNTKNIKQNNKRFFEVALIVVILFSICIRVLTISSDSPIPVPADAAFRTDQGWYSHNTLNKIQSGNWFFAEDRNEITHTALFSYIQYLSFKIFGVHLWSARIQALFFSILLIIVSTIFFIKTENSQIGFFFCLVLSFNYLHIVYSRAALVEPTVSFFIFCAFIFWYLSKIKSSYYALGTGIFSFLAVISKTHGVYFFVFLTLATIFDLLKSKMKKDIIFSYVTAIAAFVILYLIWYRIWIVPHLEYFIEFDRITHRLPENFSFSIFKIYITSIMNWIFTLSLRMPIIMSLFFVGLYKLIIEILNKNYKFFEDNYLFVLSIIWVMSHFFFFSGAHYIRPRFQMLCLIPLLFIAVSLVFNSRLMFNFRSIKQKLFFMILLFFLPFVINIWRLYSKKTLDPQNLIVASTLIIFLIFLLYIKGINLNKRRFGCYLIIFYLFVQLLPFLSWMKNSSYSIVEIGSDIRQILLDNNELGGEYILGPHAPTFALEGNFKSIASVMHHKNKKTFQTYLPKYVLFSESGGDKFKTDLPSEYTIWEPLRKFRYEVYSSQRKSKIGDKFLILYRVKYEQTFP